MEYIVLEHPRFVKVQTDVFVKTVEADCMNHQCRLLKENSKKMLDACCQYGADVDLRERDGILEHKDEIYALLSEEARDQDWFTSEVFEDADFPSGKHVRTKPFGDGCIFLSHDKRGCAIHRASIEGGWDFRGIKPDVCRLFPITFDTDSIVLSDDYPDYSCAGVTASETAKSVYQVSRNDLGDIFGAELVGAMDAAEALVLESSSRNRKAG